ncbi:MAG: sugar transferase [Elusimicrobia bacterium]|nr:sugar transferase [Elusimicrobiota bacterium]
MKRIRIRYLIILDFLVYCAAVLGVTEWHRPDLLADGRASGFLFKFAPLLIAWLAANYIVGCYEWRKLRTLAEGVRVSLYSLLAQGILGTVYFYLWEPDLGLRPKTLLAGIIGVSQLLCLAWHRAFYHFASDRFFFQRIGAVCGPQERSALRREAAANPHLVFSVVDAVPGSFDVLVVDPVWLETHWQENAALLRAALLFGLPIWPLDEFVEHWFGKILPRHAASPSWIAQFVLPRVQGAYLKWRRILDLAVGGFLFAVGAPLMGAVALCLWAADGRPILYSQPRLGRLGREFRLWKFRTMRVGADAKGAFTSHDPADSRVTSLGRWLRRLRLDELPQLWNVLRGEMSLIGPRPEWMQEVEILERALPSYHLRHLVRPGITGWAQVCYRATNNAHESAEKLLYDLYYLKNVSLSLDISVLLKTSKRIFLDDFSPSFLGAEAPAEVASVDADSRQEFGALVGRG